MYLINPKLNNSLQTRLTPVAKEYVVKNTQ